MNAKFFGNSLFGGEFFVKDAPLSDEVPMENSLKISFQAIGKNLVITGKTSDGNTVTLFGTTDTSSVSFEISKENGNFSTENHSSKNLTWNWEENILNIFVSTHEFLKAVIYDNQKKEVVYPVKVDKYVVEERYEETTVDEETGEITTIEKTKNVEKDKILVVFPRTLEDNETYTIKLLYSHNVLDVTSTIGDASLRNVGLSYGNVPEIEENGKLNWNIIPFVSAPFTINNPTSNQVISLTNGNFQIIKLNNSVNFAVSNNYFNNGDKLTLQINNNGYDVSVNGIRIDNFVGTYNLTFVKVDYVLQYWGKQEVKEIR